jgi:hypothetical protein
VVVEKDDYTFGRNPTPVGETIIGFDIAQGIPHHLAYYQSLGGGKRK